MMPADDKGPMMTHTSKPLVSRRRALSQIAASAAAGGWHAASAQGPNRPIRVGQIGTGHAHATKLSVYRDSSDYEVIGLVEDDENRRRSAADRPAFRDCPLVSQQQLLEDPSVKVVLVETEVKRSLDVAEACIAAGKHVHLDKPAGESLPQYRRLLEAAKKQGLMVQMGYMYRYNPAIVMLRDFLNRGWLGEVFEVHTVMSKVVPPAGRKEIAEFPGGIMFELGCHIIDLAVGVLGSPDKVTAYPRQLGESGDQLIDNMLAVLEYPRATATVKSSAVEVEGFARRHLVVCGTEGTFHVQPLDRPSVRVALSKSRGDYKRGYQTIEFAPYTRYVGDAADMAKIIRGEKECDFSYEHDLAVQTTVLQASNVATS